MDIQYGRRFQETFDGLPQDKQVAVVDAIESLLKFLQAHQRIPEGLGLKKIDKTRDYREIRSTLADRIIFEWTGSLITFRLTGSHDQIRRFLRSK